MERHLLPDEIDQILDGDVGFETASLKSHIRGCDRCRGELQAARQLVRRLEHLPRLSPSPRFADHVMSRVQLFVPWYVSLADTVRKLVPRSRGWRVVAAGAAGTGAVLVTAASVWIYARLDGVLFVSELIWDRLRAGAMTVLTDAVGALLGDTAAAALRGSGTAGVAALLAVVVLTGLLALGTLRLVAVRSRAR